MTPLLIGTAAYIISGILSLTYPRWRFRFSLLGWLGGVSGMVTGIAYYGWNGVIVKHLGRWGMLGVEIRIDHTTLLFVALVVVLNIFTLAYLKNARAGTFYCLYNFLLASSYSLAFSYDLFNLYVIVELMSLISILLIGYQRKPYQIYAGIKYLVISSLAMSLYFVGLGLVYRAGGNLGIRELSVSLESVEGFGLSLGLGLLLTGLAVKGGVFFFSMWLPDAYTYSGTVVTVLLAGIGTKAGLLGIIRVAGLAGWNELLTGLGVMTGLLGVVFAALASRAKRILAFSSISQAGYILLGAGLGTPMGLFVSSLHVFFHGLFKGLLFLAIGHAGFDGNRGKDDGPLSVPAASKIGVVVGSLSLMAIPPFNGYFSKTLLLEEVGSGWLRWGVLAIGSGTVIYTLKLIRMFKADTCTGNQDRKDHSLIGFAGVVAISAFGILFFDGFGSALNLLSPYHVLVTLILAAGGWLLYLVSERIFGRVSLPSFPFSMDNSLISLFTGFLIVAALLFFV